MTDQSNSAPDAAETGDVALDITGDICPMTFVRTRLALDRLPPGGRLLVRLRGAEPLRNVSASAAGLGYSVVAGQIDANGETTLAMTRR